MEPLLENDEGGRSALFLAARSGNKETFEAVMRAMTEAPKKTTPDSEVRFVCGTTWVGGTLLGDFITWVATNRNDLSLSITTSMLEEKVVIVKTVMAGRDLISYSFLLSGMRDGPMISDTNRRKM